MNETKRENIVLALVDINYWKQKYIIKQRKKHPNISDEELRQLMYESIMIRATTPFMDFARWPDIAEALIYDGIIDASFVLECEKLLNDFTTNRYCDILEENGALQKKLTIG